jgi:opacity protein-like surface antigen
MKKLSVIALMAGLGVGALAQPAAADVYVRGDVGYSVGGGADISAGAPFGGDASFEDDILALGGVGYALDNGWRIEGEIGWRSNDLDAAALLDPGGSVSVVSLMANAYYDFGGRDRAFVPYVGAGIGAAQVEVKAGFTPPLSPVTVDDSATVLAYQLMAGVTIGLGERTDLDIGYRYFSSPSVEMTGAAPPALSIPVDVDLDQQSLTLGLRWGF